MGRVSTADVARAAGVSRATVSYVLNNQPGRRIGEDTRHRVIATAEALGYVRNAAATALVSGRSRVVLLRDAVAVPAEGRKIIPLGSSNGLLRDAVASKVRAWGMTLVTCSVEFPLPEVLEHLTPCLVLAPSGMTDAERLVLERTHIPWVDGSGDDRSAVVVSALAQVQVAHLRERGHKRVAYVNADAEIIRSIASARHAAFEAACGDAGLECVGSITLDRFDDVAVDVCHDSLRQWAGQGVTAVAAFNDIFGAVALRAAERAGLTVPTELAVMGVDDEPMTALLNPALTTVRLDMAGLGTYLAARGHARLEGGPQPAFPTNVVALVPRETT